MTAPKRCSWTLAKGPIGRRKFSGCFATEAEAARAAREEAPGWKPTPIPPPGVPFASRRRRKKTARRSRQ